MMGWKKRVFEAYIPGKRNRGRPRSRWDGTVKEAFGSMVKATRLAQKQTGLSCCCEGSYALMRVCCDDDDTKTNCVQISDLFFPFLLLSSSHPTLTPKDCLTPQGFRKGMKLEAIDKKNPSLICVATVTDIMESRFLIHFDAWEDMYDYWCDSSSPYIHPVGWCEENSNILSPPNGTSNIMPLAGLN